MRRFSVGLTAATISESKPALAITTKRRAPTRPGQIGDARVIPIDIEHREQIGVIRLARVGRCCAAALQFAALRLHARFVVDQLPAAM